MNATHEHPPMGVLGSEEIRRRKNDIFSADSEEKCIKEASYELRVARDMLLVGGKWYNEGHGYADDEDHVFVAPGEIAWFSTIEKFHMPSDVVGSVGIKFKFSRLGLTPLFGFQVDPFYGRGIDDERLYLAVSNLGPSPIQITLGDSVFIIEFRTVAGDVQWLHEERGHTGKDVAKVAAGMAGSAHQGFVNAIRQELRQEFGVRLESIEKGTRQLVMFGVFLVAAALLAGALTALFAILSTLPDDGARDFTFPMLNTWFRRASIAILIAISIILVLIFVNLVLQLFTKIRDSTTPIFARYFWKPWKDK